MLTPLKLKRFANAFAALNKLAANGDGVTEASLQAALASLPQTLMQLGYLQTLALLSNRQDVEKLLLQSLIDQQGKPALPIDNAQLRQLTRQAIRFADSLKVLSKQPLTVVAGNAKVNCALSTNDLLRIDERHSALLPPQRLQNSTMHHGLKFEKFFDTHEKIPVEAHWRLNWIKQFTGMAIGENAAIQEAHKDLKQIAVNCLGGEAIPFKTSAPLAVGLGYEHATENGILWHHTLGVPYLPASSVKGLLRAWMCEWTDFDRVDDWFGTTKKLGRLTVFDALPSEAVNLKTDVTTPHWGKWGERIAGVNFPADWIDPKPVQWLHVQKNTQFTFYLALKDAGQEEKAQVKEFLQMALLYLGAGTKTASGYGRFDLNN